MELPHMGQHCSEKTCKQLDYLPMKCDACGQLFCKDHLQYDLHACASKYKKNVQVPVCPLCNSPVPVERGAVPDLAVSAHIEADCQTRAKQKVFTNRCNKVKCKKKELVPVICDTCRLNFCLAHRHPADHDCKGNSAANTRNAAAEAASQRISASSTSSKLGQSKITNFFTGPFQGGRPQPSPAAVAAMNRQAGRGTTPGRPLRATTSGLQGGLSEDEALAAALAASMSDVGGSQGRDQSQEATHSQEEEDRLLAQALQESERTARRTAAAGGSTGQDKNCSMQ